MTIEWGPVSSWVSAILTSGSLILGFSILIRDRKARKADQAAGVSAVWDREQLVVRVHNTSKQAVYNIHCFPYLAVHVLHEDAPPDYKKEGWNEWQGPITHIEPESVKIFKPNLERLANRTPTNVDIMFVDSRGETWGRTARGKLVSGLNEALYLFRTEKYPGPAFKIKRRFSDLGTRILWTFDKKKQGVKLIDRVRTGGQGEPQAQSRRGTNPVQTPPINDD